ncbi:hypothetical protein EVAR_58762_1 [Eumeta japonica]|uniref:Uncharacterized protein n=1 Tax=Eumeta variegata TaxID=151549 RepID=A0A4C1ZFM9_EUMVA|nr:hypothetical protein EVAR_58762_1 [Eumeta japonica]
MSIQMSMHSGRSENQYTGASSARITLPNSSDVHLLRVAMQGKIYKGQTSMGPSESRRSPPPMDIRRSRRVTCALPWFFSSFGHTSTTFGMHLARRSKGLEWAQLLYYAGMVKLQMENRSELDA